MLNTASFNDFVVNATIIWKKAFDSVDQAALNSGAFERMDLAPNTGEDKEFSEIDGEMYLRTTDEGEKTPEVLQQQGYTKRMVYYEKKGKVAVTDTMRRRNKYRDIVAKLTELGEMVPNTRERDLSLRFTFASATSYTDSSGKTIDTTTGDGLAVCATAHLLRGTSDTYRNRVSGDPIISQTALEAAEKLFEEEIQNQFGEKTQCVPDTLITSRDPNTMNTVREILQSTAKISAANAGVKNVYEGKYQHVALPLLAITAAGVSDTTKRGYWFLVNSKRPPFVYSSEVDVQKKAWIDEDTDTWFYKVFASWGIVAVQPRSIVGSFPTLS